MATITIGKAGRNAVALDVGVLIRTRLLVQAASGNGKSYLLRLLAELLFGKVPVHIIDPEGEFASLRELFGYVLVGKGGETPADCRSAALVATRLLETRASAVCDIYELKSSERHRWVKLYLDALLDAPKHLWRPTVVIVDEAHIFCPETKAGESEASEAMSGLATRGRKRGFCAVFATQRLGKLKKDAAAELLNNLIGGTSLDIDRRRAAEQLGIDRPQMKKFFDEVRMLEPGEFFALGRAISKERILFKVGKVRTTHPESGDSKYASAPPPPPEKVKRLLPKLADLPKEAEEKARTEADLRKEIRSLKAQLRSRPQSQPEVKADRGVVDREVHRAVKARDGFWEKEVAKVRKNLSRAEKALEEVRRVASFKSSSVEVCEPPKVRRPKPEPAPKAPIVRPSRQLHEDNGDSTGEVTQPQKKILTALSEFEALGQSDVPRTWLAALAGVSHKSSGFSNNLGSLRSGGLIEYRPGKRIAITAEGGGHVSRPDPPETNSEMLQRCFRVLTLPQQNILKPLYEVHPDPMGREDLAEAAGVSPVSSGYSNNLGALRSAGMIEYLPGRKIRCSDWLFVEVD